MLVPGTGGVRFTFSDGTPAPYVVEMFEDHYLGNDQVFYSALGCTHDPLPDSLPPDFEFGPNATTLVPGKKLEPGPILEGTAYQTVVDFGVDLNDVAKYYPFAYDWRLDVRYNARLLLEVLQNSNADTRWNILCHSQGGLVVIAASLMAGSEQWLTMVRNVAFVAIPFVGTARSMQAILEGANFGKMLSPVFRKTARTWPALYQMFPQYFCIKNEPAAGILNYGFWTSLGTDGQQLLNRAANFWHWIDYHPFRAMDPNAIGFFLARSDAPNTPVYATADRVSPPTITTDLDVGDTLVPWTPTTQFLKWSGLEPRILPITGALQKDHAYLLNDAAVFRVAHQFLASP